MDYYDEHIHIRRYIMSICPLVSTAVSRSIGAVRRIAPVCPVGPHLRISIVVVVSVVVGVVVEVTLLSFGCFVALATLLLHLEEGPDTRRCNKLPVPPARLVHHHHELRREIQTGRPLLFPTLIPRIIPQPPLRPSDCQLTPSLS